MIKALMFDFYGTLVHEDDAIIPIICEKIRSTSSNQVDTKEIGDYWWKCFSGLFVSSYGDRFESQRDLEIKSLQQTIQYFQAEANPFALAELLFDYWITAPIFDETKPFLEALNVPICIVSNIDRSDIEAAISHHDLSFQSIITSDDARSYKPRSEIFDLALGQLNLARDEVLHVGDSLTSDVAGAKRYGIPVAWINRKRSDWPRATENSPDYVVQDLKELLPILDHDFKSGS